MDVYAFLRDEAGFDPGEVQGFLAGGMMVNTMVGLRMTDDYDTNPAVRELLAAAFPEKLALLREMAQRQREREAAERETSEHEARA
jgi:hypothetical protein